MSKIDRISTSSTGYFFYQIQSPLWHDIVLRYKLPAMVLAGNKDFHNFFVPSSPCNLQSFNYNRNLKVNRSRKYKKIKLFVLPYVEIYMLNKRRTQQCD